MRTLGLDKDRDNAHALAVLTSGRPLGTLAARDSRRQMQTRKRQLFILAAAALVSACIEKEQPKPAEPPPGVTLSFWGTT